MRTVERNHEVLTSLPAPNTRAHELLMKVVDRLQENGSVNISLRQLAADVGTSHRMLQYYFDSRERLLGLVMMHLSREYIANFSGNRPTTRVEAIEATWSRFRDPNNRLQTQLLFALSGAAAEQPDLEIPGLTEDLDNFAMALTALGTMEGLALDRAQREGRLIVATLLGLYLDYFITKGSSQVDDSFTALVEWVGRSSAESQA